MDSRQYNDSESEEEYRNSRVKSNSINTLKKFYKPRVELVNTLEFRNLLVKKQERYKMNSRSVVEKMKEDKLFKVSFKSNFLNSFVEERMENISIESEFEKKIRNLENNIKEIEIEMTKLIEMITEINKQIKDKYLRIDSLNYLEIIDNEKIINLSPSKRKRFSDEKLLLIRKISLSREKENEECKDELNKYKIMKIDHYDEYKCLEKKLQIKKSELKEYKYKLMNHYHNLLSEGKDTRKEGLSWIIKAIWKLGFEVLISNMPKYLDENCIKFLFQYSKKGVEMSQIKEKIGDLKAQLQSLKFQNKVFKTDVKEKRIKKEKKEQINSILPIVKEMYKTKVERFMDEGHQLTVGRLENFVPIVKNFDEESWKLYKLISNLENEHDCIKNEMHEMKIKLLNDINKEFISNEYQRRFNISLEGLVNSLIGEEFLIPEMIRQSKLKKDHQKNVNLCSTYNVVNCNLFNKKKLSFETILHEHTIV